MIDWWGLFHNAVWVLGLAVILGAFAMASFQARTQGVRLREGLRASSFLLPFGVGMVLFCLGLLFSSQTWWEKVLWGLLSVLIAVQVFWLWRGRGGEGAESGPGASAGSQVEKPVGTTVLEEREP